MSDLKVLILLTYLHIFLLMYILRIWSISRHDIPADDFLFLLTLIHLVQCTGIVRRSKRLPTLNNFLGHSVSKKSKVIVIMVFLETHLRDESTEKNLLR